jgi:regulator of sigma E protease
MKKMSDIFKRMDLILFFIAGFLFFSGYSFVLIFVFILFILVIVHEFGHFVAAKLSKMRVEEFAFGFPPRIWGKKKGETMYAVNVLPLGGYVKITGEGFDEEERERLKHDHRAFQNRPKILQLFVLAAGVIMNFLLAFLIISFTYTKPHYVPVSEMNIEEQKKVGSKIVSIFVLPNSPAASGGLAPNDEILKVTANGQLASLKSATSVVEFVGKNVEYPITIVYKKMDGKVSTSTIQAVYGLVTDRKTIGLQVEEVALVRYNYLKALGEGLKDTARLTKNTVLGLGEIVKRLSNGENVIDAVAGPIGIAKLTSSATEAGSMGILTFIALLSINLGVFNALPIPALDGGRFLFVLIEMITRRNLNYKFQYYANAVGFLFLLSLVLIVTYKDIFL